MKNIKLLTSVLLFSGLLAGCGMKGPLYRTPVKQEAAPVAVEKKEIHEEAPVEEKTEQDNLEQNAQ